MNIEEIKQEISRLEELYLQQNDGVHFTDKILLTYNLKVLGELKASVNKPDQTDESFLQTLKLFLENNWKLVKGTLLSYTALPESDVTQLLCEIATYIANEDAEKKLTAINFLMPDVSYDSISLDYPNLDSIDLGRVLKTHVLSQDNLYLIPVSLLADEELIFSKKKFPNIYFDIFDIDDENGSPDLTEEDLKLVAQHSAETTAIWNLRTQYQTLSENKDSLLGQLNILDRALLYNSKTGIGQETESGIGIYSAIASFSEYWGKLSSKVREKLPSVLLTEIGTLLSLASPQLEKENNKTRNHVNIINTCLDTRRKYLQQAMKGHEIRLDGIGLTGKQKESQIDQINQALLKAVESLRKALKENAYSGREQRGITTKILCDLKIDLEFSSLAELIDVLKGISDQEVSAICELEGAPEKIVRAISSVENLVLLTTEFSDKVLQSLFCGIKNNIGNIIKSLEDFRFLFMPLNVNQCLAVCEALKVQLLSMIKRPSDFYQLLRYLSSEQVTIIVEALKEQLSLIIKSPSDFNQLLTNLSPEKCKIIFEALKEQWPSIIKSPSDFNQLLRYLSSEQRTIIFEALKEQLPSMIESPSDFSQLLSNLNSEQRTIIFEELKEQLPSMVKSPSDFNQLLRYLSSEQRAIIFEALKEQLPSIIISSCFKIFGGDLGYVFEYLTPGQRTIIFEALKEQLPLIIKKGYFFNTFLQYLNPEQRTITFEALKEQLPTMVGDFTELSQVLQYLTCEQSKFIIEVLKKDRLRSGIKTFYNLKQLFKHITPEQCKIIIEALEQQLPLMIESPDLKKVFEYFIPEQTKIIVEVLMPLMIKSPFDLKKVFEYFSPEQVKIIVEALEQQLPSMIKSPSDFNQLLSNLSSEQRTIIFEALKEQLPSMIKSPSDFNQMLRYLSSEQVTIIFKALKEQWPLMIKSPSDFDKMLHYLSSEQRTIIFEALKEQLPSMIKSPSDFNQLLSNLSSEQRTIIIEALKEQLPSMIKSPSDFNQLLMLSNLNSEQVTIIVEALGEYLLLIIKDPNFSQIFNSLSPEQRTIIAEARNKQPHLITNSFFDSTQLLEKPTPEHNNVRFSRASRFYG